MYPEYTGTGWAAVLKEKPPRDPSWVMRELRRRYQAEYDATWLDSFGFSDAYTLAMPRRRAAELRIQRISDLLGRSDIAAGFASEFLARTDDGWPALAKYYGLSFARGPFAMEAGLMYRAAVKGQVDVISAYSTDGRLASMDFVTLEDDRRFFPPYEAALVVRRSALVRVPKALSVLEKLSHRISEEDMRRMNAEAEGGRRKVPEIARDFLASHPAPR